MSRKFYKKIYLIPFIWAIAGFFIITSVLKANENILISGKLWEQGLAFWETNISVEAGQEFKITLFASNFDQINSVTTVSLVDNLPQNTNYIDDSSFVNNTPGGSWQAFTDDDTTPFDGVGVIPHSGTLAPFEFANYKYTVKVDDILPAGTTQLTWAGPVLNFTDGSGAQTKPQMESTTIAVENLPSITNFSIPNGINYILGDSIDISTTGTIGKTAYVEIGSITINLSESGGVYTGSHTVQAGDDMSPSISRLFLVDGNNKGAYLDFGQTIEIDATPPPEPTNLLAPVDEDTLQATLVWDLPADESDILQYNIYSNSGTGTIDYTSPINSVSAGVNGYTTPPLTVDALYVFAVRAQDVAGNIEQNTNTVDAPTDFVPPNPPLSLIQPTSLNDTVFKFDAENPLVFLWEESDSLDVDHYLLEIDDDSDFTSVVGSFSTASPTDGMTLTTSDITLPDSVFYWRLFAIDDANLLSSAQTLPDNSFEIDNTNPEITLTQPTSGSHISGNFTISGTSTDPNTHQSGTGVTSVEVFLIDLIAGGSLFWNGASWESASSTIPVITSDGFANWEYEFTAPITDIHTYVTGAKVTDEAGNTLDTSIISLVGNKSTPDIEITSPVAGSYLAGSTNIQGISDDNNKTVISDVSLTIKRSDDNFYWDGATWVAAETFNVVTSTDSFATWAYTFNPDGTSLESSVYTVTARAKDGVIEHPNESTTSLTLNKDTIAPTTSITSPIDSGIYKADTWLALNPIQGTANDSGSGVAGVEVAIQDSISNYWNGTDWSSSNVVWLTATSTNSFATWKYIGPSTDFVPDKDDIFKIYSRATDNVIDSPNISEQGSGITITYDTTAPQFNNAILSNDTLSITTLIKNGDTVVLSAGITDLLGQADMSVASITANLTSIGSTVSVQPVSYNSLTGTTTWPFKTVSGTGDGDISISITATDSAGNSATFTNTAIVVADNTNPSITTIPSVPFATLKGGTTQNITWDNTLITDTNINDNPILLEYATSTTWNLISSNELNDGLFDWNVPSIDSQNVTLRITATDKVALSATSTSSIFTIDSTAPSISSNALISPDGEEAWKQGTEQIISWDNNLITDLYGLATGPITLEYATSSVWNLISSGEDNDGTYDWIIPVIDNNNVTVRITAADAAGNTSSDQSNNTFAIGLPPVITEARAVGDTLIEVTWNKSISDAGSFGNYTATGITATAVATTTTPTIINLTISSIGDTAFSSSDFSVAANTVKDTDNFFNELESGKTILDKQVPVTDSSTSHPLPNQLIVGQNPYLNISVSEAPNASSTVQLDGASKSYTYNSTDKKIIVAPDSTLAPGKHTIIVNIIDTQGNVGISQTWDFWIDNFTTSINTNPAIFKFAGNLVDTTDGTEQQQVNISTYGAGYTVYAFIPNSIDDGFGNEITDVEIKETNGVWTSLNGTNFVQVAQVAKLTTPSDTPIATNYVFDLRSTITQILAAGEYDGKLEFVVLPEY
jgi:hypothetical protein